MSNFRKEHSNLFRLNEELRGIICPALDLQPEPEGLQQYILLYALTKAYKTQGAALLLSENGFGQSAGILSRAIFELAITTLYILEDETGGRAERFFDYDWVMRANLYDYIVNESRIADGFEQREDADEIIGKILEEAQRVKDKYPKIGVNNRWSDETFKAMARAVGAEDAYKTAYHLQCNLSHPNPRDVNEYFSERQGGLVVHAGPDNNWISQSLVASFDFFIRLVQAWNKEFNFGLESKLEDLVDRYGKEVGKTNPS